MNDKSTCLSSRALEVDGEGIRRALEGAERLTNPINLSVGQPDFDVPYVVREALVFAIHNGGNGYAPSGGLPELNSALQARFMKQYPKWCFDGTDAGSDSIVCSGVTSAIFFALSAITNPGDEIIIPDPDFFHYGEIVSLLGGVPVRVSTYPDFELTSDRVNPFISNRTKAIILSSPGNPTGAVLSRQSCADLVKITEQHNLILVVDEIYRDFYYSEDGAPCPSVAEYTSRALVLRGLAKSHGMTGWRIGFAFGPRDIISCMRKLQGLTIVSAPRPMQRASLVALDYSVHETITEYGQRSQIVGNELKEFFQPLLTQAGFFFFVAVPPQLRLTGSEFCRLALERNVILVPGKVFSSMDTHFRLSLTAPVASLLTAIARLNDIVDEGVNG
jgi:aspartate/methionine/tyrosine aminotransferase